MISLTLNSKKGRDLTSYTTKSNAIGVVTTAGTLGGASFSINTNWVTKSGDTFVHPVSLSVFTATTGGTTLFVTVVTSGTLAVGQTIISNGGLTNTITGMGTGTGGTGNYVLARSVDNFSALTYISYTATTTHTCSYVTINGANDTLIGITPAFTAIAPVGYLITFTPPISNTLGYSVAGLSAEGNNQIGSSFVRIKYFVLQGLFSNLNNTKLLIGTDTTEYTVTKANCNYTPGNQMSFISVDPVLVTAPGADTRLVFYSKTYNNMSYNIDANIFNNIYKSGKKCAISFSFSSLPMVLNQYSKIPAVYINFGNDFSYDNNNGTTQTNFLGFLKNNLVFNAQNVNTAATPGNTQYSSLIADPANVPLVVTKPNSTLNISILNEDGTPFVDNSNTGIMPPYVITLYFKEID